MIELLKKEIASYGDRYRIVSIKCLNDLKREINNFIKNEDLNNFQKYIVNSLYKLEVPDVDFLVKILICK